MHILVCDDDAAFSAKVAEYAAAYFEAHEIPVQATVCSDPEQVLAIPDLELYRIAFLDVDMPQVNGIALGGQLRHRTLRITRRRERVTGPRQKADQVPGQAQGTQR